MIALLKTFGKGILYVLGFPFFLVALLLFAVFGLGAFVFQLVRSIIFFFTGQKFFPELPEDKELRLMLHPEQAEEEKEVKKDVPSTPVEETSLEEAPVLETITTSEPVQEQPQTIEDVVFEKPTPVSEPQPEPVNESDDPFVNMLLNEEPKQAPQVEPQVQTITRFCPYCGSPNVIKADQKQYKCFSCCHDVDVPDLMPQPQVQQEPIIDTTQATPNKPEPKEEILEVYTPRTNTYTNQVQGDEETDNGVTIDFDN